MAIVSKSWALLFRGVAAEVVETSINDAADVDGMNIVINVGDNRRSVEINNAWDKCMNAITDNSLMNDGVALDLFIQCPIDESGGAEIKSGVSGVGTYDDDVVAISVEAVLRTRAPGSLTLHSLVEYCKIAANDNYLKLV